MTDELPAECPHLVVQPSTRRQLQAHRTQRWRETRKLPPTIPSHGLQLRRIEKMLKSKKRKMELRGTLILVMTKTTSTTSTTLTPIKEVCILAIGALFSRPSCEDRDPFSLFAAFPADNHLKGLTDCGYASVTVTVAGLVYSSSLARSRVAAALPGA